MVCYGMLSYGIGMSYYDMLWCTILVDGEDTFSLYKKKEYIFFLDMKKIFLHIYEE